MNGKNVYDVLQLTVDEAIRFFPREEKLGQALWQLQQVWTRLSATRPARRRRFRAARRSDSRSRASCALANKTDRQEALRDGRADDRISTSTTSENSHRSFDRLVDAGHTLVLIEHNLDVIKLRRLGDRSRDRRRAIAAVRSSRPAGRRMWRESSASHTGQWLRTGAAWIRRARMRTAPRRIRVREPPPSEPFKSVACLSLWRACRGDVDIDTRPRYFSRSDPR